MKQQLRPLMALLVFGLILPGCAVPQSPGKGTVMHLREPQSKAGYWLYLPVDYVEEHKDAKVTTKKYPLVMTFHGMKPFDNAHSQIGEWQQEADRYGFVVCAPELDTPDLYSPVPLKKIIPPLNRDEKAILAVMDEVMRTTDVNPSAVLVTSWSYGGYLAHYMINRHPSRFTCLAVRQSNFSADILDPKQADKYRDRKIAVFYTENDFAICQRESQEAALWYSHMGFDLTFREFSKRGHERTPSLAAAFFARSCGAEPKTSSAELAQLQVRDIPVLDRTNKSRSSIPGVAAGNGDEKPAPILPQSAQPPSPSQPTPQRKAQPQPDRTTLASAGYNIYDTSQAGGRASSAPTSPPPVERKTEVLFPKPAGTASPLRTRPAKPTPTPAPPPSPRREFDAPVPPTPAPNPVRVRLSSTIGIAPLLVSYSAAVPNRLKDRAYFLWTDNGEPMSNGINGQKFFSEPGEHDIEVLVTTSDGQEFRASSTVTVLERISRKGGE